ncbi:MAG: 16S rRNA (cytidine(1402)-2'-O)-methyltransferase [Peptostreptococcaceae bacterium]|nr:16S rRNA (cytidine(1402)-2'-O)-methyltransferase [uncultured Criibacterium sp.]MBS6063093.1 16S rRNA (cytidine(1402)-2'-O)-methyltransferase [Peptostreptococcaceae bacterium]
MLYICPTPIGNLQDITIRTLETLKSVDEIYCEDTRNTIKLLNHYEISKPLYSMHEHNENEKSEEIINKLSLGKNIAYVSDAGMPGISDPGAILISYCIKNGAEFTTLPGASAFVVALVSSGLDTAGFFFKGFLDRNNGKKKQELREFSEYKNTVIIYESPNRTASTIKSIYEIFGDRNVVIAREISKKFEEYIRGSLSQVNEQLEKGDLGIKGEVIILVEGKKEIKEQISEKDILNELKKNIKLGLSQKDAIKVTASNLKVSKNTVYSLSINNN